MNKSFLKKLSVGLTVVLALSAVVMGCSKKTQTTGSNSQKPAVLKFFLMDDFEYQYFTETKSLNKEYQKTHPNVTIEFEKAKDSGDFESALKIRNSANELPDLMVLKPYMLANFSEAMADLTNIEATKNNLYAKQYAVDGKIMGIPEITLNEFVYYRKSIFKKYNLEVPQTWDEFIKVAQKIKEKNEYIPILLGAKDAWPDYPYNEFMPSLEAVDGSYWNTMATKEEPFKNGEPFNTAYRKIQKLFDAKVFGNDPLGMGADQAKAKFNAGEGAMIALGQWFLSSIEDTSDVGTFFLPVRNAKEDKFYTTIMADAFLSTPKEGKNKKEAIEFINWYLSNEYYSQYLNARGVTSPVKDVKISNKMIDEAFSSAKPEFIVFDGGNNEFNRIKDAISFDVKKLGQEMLAGKNLDEMMNKLNKDWKNAKNKK